MLKSELERFGKIMSGLGEAYSIEVSKEKIKIYAEALKEYRIEDIESACWTLIKSQVYFPKVAEIISTARQIIIERKQNIKKLPELRADAKKNAERARETLKQVVKQIAEKKET